MASPFPWTSSWHNSALPVHVLQPCRYPAVREGVRRAALTAMLLSFRAWHSIRRAPRPHASRACPTCAD